MIVVRIDGGLGNQMFQYALYRYVTTLVPEEKVAVDVHSFNPHQSGTVADYFPVKPRRASKSTLRYFHRNGFWHLLRPIDRMGITGHAYYREEELTKGRGLDAVLRRRSAYLRGYWQKACYAEEVRARLLKEFDLSAALEQPQLSEEIREKNLAFLKEIEAVEAVAVHIRGGDYLAAAHSYGGVCTEEYYGRAVSEICSRVTAPRFYIFTNDIPYMESFAGAWEGKDVKLVDVNDEEHGHLDMLLMSRCKHHIIANSSFSFWGAWLGTYPSQTVMMPGQWDNGKSSEALCRPGWIRLVPGQDPVR